LGRRPLGAILHSSNEPGELSQWLCHDDSTINIVVLIIIIIIYFALYINTNTVTQYRNTMEWILSIIESVVCTQLSGDV